MNWALVKLDSKGQKDICSAATVQVVLEKDSAVTVRDLRGPAVSDNAQEQQDPVCSFVHW